MGHFFFFFGAPGGTGPAVPSGNSPFGKRAGFGVPSDRKFRRRSGESESWKYRHETTRFFMMGMNDPNHSKMKRLSINTGSPRNPPATPSFR